MAAKKHVRRQSPGNWFFFYFSFFLLFLFFCFWILTQLSMAQMLSVSGLLRLKVSRKRRVHLNSAQQSKTTNKNDYPPPLCNSAVFAIFRRCVTFLCVCVCVFLLSWPVAKIVQVELSFEWKKKEKKSKKINSKQKQFKLKLKSKRESIRHPTVQRAGSGDMFTTSVCRML